MFFEGVVLTPNFCPVEEGLEIEKNLIRFLNREINVVRVSYIITRVQTFSNGVDHIVARPEGSSFFFEFEKYYNSTQQQKNDHPKHTGGKKPYIMLMIEEVEDLRKKGVKNVEELIGYLVCLGRYVEWSTGRLVKKRSKKPLQYKDLKEIFPCGNKKLNRVLSDLKEHDLLYSTQEGYFVSNRIIKKGRKKGTARDGL